VPKVRWLVLATSILIVGGLWLRWWTARGTIREIHRLGGRYSAATSAGIRGAFEVILAVDVTVDEITFETTVVPDEFFDRLSSFFNTLLGGHDRDSGVSGCSEVTAQVAFPPPFRPG
jgi:hypothetical protein